MPATGPGGGFPKGTLGLCLIIHQRPSPCLSAPPLLSSPKNIYLKSCDQRVKKKIKQDIKMKKFLRRLECQDHFY